MSSMGGGRDDRQAIDMAGRATERGDGARERPRTEPGAHAKGSQRIPLEALDVGPHGDATVRIAAVVLIVAVFATIALLLAR